MPDVQELSDGDMDVVERMKSLPDSVLFGEETEDTKAGQERSDDPDAPDEIRDGPEALESEAAAEQEAGEQGEAAADPEFDIPDPEGGEARKVKLSELLGAERELTAFKAEKAQIFQRAEQEADQLRAQRMGQMEQASQQMAMQIHAALQMIAAPVPPDIELRNPASAKYDPDRYETERYHFEQRQKQYGQAQHLAQHFATQAQQMAAARTEERESRELERLNRVWPEFAKGETLNAFVADMGKHYGYSQQELDESLNDHRNVLVARDALKWREHEAKQKSAKLTVKDKVAAKAPAKVAPNAGATRTLTSEQSAYMNNRKALKANGKDMNAAAKAMMRFL